MDREVRDELTRWQVLAAKVSAENDPTKVPELLKELCEELERCKKGTNTRVTV
jgi:hypothetical protein